MNAQIHSQGGAVPQLDDLKDLAARVRFRPQEGRIWLDEQRMFMLHSDDLSVLRRELLDTLGLDGARGVLTRMGYAAGARDATLAVQLRGLQNLQEAFAAGPQLHALEGFVAVEPVRIEVDVERGVHYVEQLWHDSIEAAAHLVASGPSHDPACWMQIGYASGFNSTLFGRPILFRELSCKACGASHCRIVGKPADEWADADSEKDLRFLRPEDFVNATLARNKPTPLKDGQGLPIEDDDQDAMVGVSPAFLSACHKLQRVASTQATVLLLGETGVGKERFARMLHRLSPRASRPFVALNCAAIPEALLESELFGVERGAYTGASESRQGRFERAHGGTLFLDEIGTLNEGAQAKLLRALQERQIERVGSSTARTVDVRVVAATNVQLDQAVQSGHFRADLFYRLNVFPIQIPPLRERRDDIALLVHHFIQRYSRLHGKHTPGLTHQAIAALLSYDYPGNVRELENLIERALILVEPDHPLDRGHLFQGEKLPPPQSLAVGRGGDIGLSDLLNTEADDDHQPIRTLINEALDARLSLEALELAAMTEAVRRAEGNLSSAARQLGMTRAQLAYRLEKAQEKAQQAAHERAPNSARTSPPQA